ncbi:mannonate dehydratase [Mucilaginibacter sp. SG564]|uniref:mannonate dehydratase n=1 Tax=Mucilaginibacter sp. SG564 TaxID=2587022 RepID=UPI001556BF3D|nr:mannonate dehydratase [Mucilaginibacter sp. SG564]NOW96389.1 mannonate dehydratase [Mucilaginibacter sp. SG564]
MVPDLEKCFRWFGPDDPVTLNAIRQTGAVGIVTALHHIPCGDIWTINEIQERLRLVENAGFRWSVVESVNVHESIKIGGTERNHFIANYIQTLKNLAEVGIKTVCYNFMPVLDWTRTNLDYRLPNAASALYYSAPALAAFDLYILKRPGASDDFTAAQQVAAKACLDAMTAEQTNVLTNTILAGLPGTDEVFTTAEFHEYLQKYQSINKAVLQENLAYFLRAIIPVAEALGIKMCIHPDDPPFPILGLPRAVCNEEDLHFIINACLSPANGITLCTGSLGANPQNDIPAIISRLGRHMHFLHLRNVQRLPDGSFYETNHLAGSTNMYEVMRAVILEQQKRVDNKRGDVAIPLRPDHGHKLLDDFNYNTYPGYSVIGRLKGLAELRGLEMGIKMEINKSLSLTTLI